jgi:hypothetical protein
MSFNSLIDLTSLLGGLTGGAGTDPLSNLAGALPVKKRQGMNPKS